MRLFVAPTGSGLDAAPEDGHGTVPVVANGNGACGCGRSAAHDADGECDWDRDGGWKSNDSLADNAGRK